MGEDSGEKTEEPTSHKLREARKKGQIMKSREITAAALFFVSFFTLQYSAQSIWRNLSEIMMFSFDQIPKEFDNAVVGKILQDTLNLFLLSLLPIFIMTFAVAVLLEALQTQFLFTMEPLKPKLDKLNPIAGFKKFFQLKQYVELLKSVIKMIIVVYILYQVLMEKMNFIVLTPQLTLWNIMGVTGDIVMTVVIRAGIFYALIALFDYFYQRWEFMKSMKMTKKEIKDEYKKLEGDPLVKQRQRDAAREMAMNRQMGSVPNADVVVTNPTHLAVAIYYQANKMRAPMVLAKGQRLIAEKIKQIAQANNVPIVENMLLAQALYATTEPGMLIPREHFKAVAEILAFVYNLKKKRKRKY